MAFSASHELKTHVEAKCPDAALFTDMPPVYDIAHMLRSDLDAVQIPFESDSGRVDFHSMRTICLSWLADTGTPLRTLQEFARYSTPTLTMTVYARVLRDSLGDAAARLPDLGPPNPATVRATGTDGGTADRTGRQTTPRTTPNAALLAASTCASVHPSVTGVRAIEGRKTPTKIGRKPCITGAGNDSHRTDSNR